MPFLTTPSGRFGYFSISEGVDPVAAKDLSLSINGDTATCSWDAGSPYSNTVYLQQSSDQYSWSTYTSNENVTTTSTVFTSLPQEYFYRFYVSSIYPGPIRVDSEFSSAQYVYGTNYTYVVQNVTGNLYWANGAGTPQSGPVEATNPVYDNGVIVTADYNGVPTSVTAQLTVDFIEAGYGYVKYFNLTSQEYFWCNQNQNLENPPVQVFDYDYEQERASRYGILWNVLTLFNEVTPASNLQISFEGTKITCTWDAASVTPNVYYALLQSTTDEINWNEESFQELDDATFIAEFYVTGGLLYRFIVVSEYPGIIYVPSEPSSTIFVPVPE